MKRPNLILLVTDQQRQPRHWPDEAGWVRQLMPNDAELASTGLTFNHAFCNTAMCSPSRTTLFTGRYPAEHGVTLTLTGEELQPDPRYAPAVARTMAGILRRNEAPRRRVLRQFARGALRLGPHSGNEPVLPTSMDNLATLLRAAGYEVAYKGKWHLTHPQGADPGMLSGWGKADAELIARDYGFADWEPPDAGENTKAENFGGGNAGYGEGWDEVYTREVERWLAREDLPEPFCLVVSLVNPHDVLGYPGSYERGGYDVSEFRDLGVELPPTFAENLRSKPAVHSLMRMGMTAYLGPLSDRQANLDYVNFYAYLHGVVDQKIGRILKALGDATDPESLRARTVVVRSADHGEMGLSHGGLRQKAFNAYEETINIPMVVSNPVLFGKPAETNAFASLIDLLPTMLALGGADAPDDLRGRDLTPVLANHADPQGELAERAGVDLSAVAGHPAPSPSVQDAIHFTFDDHQAATASQEAPGQPNRVRAIRTADAKYALYYDPEGRAGTEYELYDLERDFDETDNLVDVRTGQPRSRAGKLLRDELAERLDLAMDACRTTPGD